MRLEKSYSGFLMETGISNEEIILQWLKKNGRNIIDFREFRLAQRIDVDFGIETIDGVIVLAEIKSDRWIGKSENFLFENHRINHFVRDKWFYLGWGWRSPAQKLIIRNPTSGETFVFRFSDLRKFVAEYVGEVGKDLKTCIVETDKQKTTFNYLLPMNKMINLYKKFLVK